MRVHFTNEMRVFDVLKSVNSEVDTLEIKSSEVFGNDTDLRMLQSDEIFGVLNDILKVQALPGLDSYNDEDKLAMEWSMQRYEPTYMELKINFTNPTFVSTQGGYDQIEVEFNS